MSKKGIHHRKVLPDGELTVLDFADAASPRGKLRKGKQLRVIKPQTFDDEVNMDFEETADELKPRQRRIKTQEDPNHVYNDYISDIWWIISEYIRPEDIFRFALICKKTEAIVTTARFWINLYKRHYSANIELPTDLQPDCVKRLGGLRCRVVRSLFYTYNLFALRLLKRPTNFDFLCGLQCAGSWHKCEGKTWIYCFKLFSGVRVRPPGIVENTNAGDNSDDENFEAFLAQFNNIFENPDEGCCIFVFTAERYYPVPNFWGSQKVYLTGIRQPLSRDLSHFNLELDFSNYRKHMVIGRALFPSVTNIRVVNWWSPDYRLYSNPL